MSLGRLVRQGAIAGTASGVVGAAMLYLLVEPALRKAIALEEAGSPVDHDAAASHIHHEAEVIVTRGAQVAVGMLTVLLVGALIGIAFAIAHHRLRDRLPGNSAFSRALALAGLGFVALTLAPAVVIPANPPAVGDPGTVNYRTIIYVAAIACALVLVCGVAAFIRTTREWPVHQRGAAATFLAVVGAGVLLWAVPAPTEAIPEGFPTHGSPQRVASSVDRRGSVTGDRGRDRRVGDGWRAGSRRPTR
jgi:hypothetical protein